MKRLAVLSARALIVLLLVLAVMDVRIPGSSAGRRRLHLIDRSDSVRLEGGLVPRDADSIRAADSAAPGDEISWASFGRDVSFESEKVDPSGTDLGGALEAALARNPTEIVLYTDGRADPGRALFLCRSRGVPVHVFPLGPVSPRDVRLARIQAPDRLAPGERGRVEVTVESTFATPAKVRAGDESRDVTLVPGIPLTVPFPGRGPGKFEVRVEAQDDFARNNAVPCEIETRSDRRKVLVLAPGVFPSLPEFDLKIAAAYEQPRRYDAVVLAGLGLKPDEQRDLARYAGEFGGGVLLLGGRQSHELGRWKGTPLEEISPLRASPDQKVAVVFGIDSSGSMKPVWEAVTEAVSEAVDAFGTGDDVIPMTFSGSVEFPTLDRLRKMTPSGGTDISKGIDEARKKLVSIDAGRKAVFLFTDGNAATSDTPERQRAAAELLGEIALTVVTTDKTIAAPRARQLKIKDWSELHRALASLVVGIRDNQKDKPGALELQEHPVTRGVPRVELPWMNLTTAKPQSRVVGTVGRAPAVYPAVAFRTVGRGTAGAFAFEAHPDLQRLLVQAIEHVAGEAAGGLALSIDPPLLRARGNAPAGTLKAVLGRREVRLEQVRSDLWEGTLPPLEAGTVFAKCGGALASATIACSPEDAALGVDRKALERIARDTGGRVLRSRDDLAALPRPARPEPRSGRPFFLVAALALVFVELALTTFWKER